MLKNFIPDQYVRSVADIDLFQLKKQGVRGIICDLDNTLDDHKTPLPSAAALSFLNRCAKENFSVCIISNGKEERVVKYTQNLNIPAFAKAGKPLAKSYKKALRLLDLSPQNVAFVGDQIFTDVWGANRMQIKTILVEPIKSIENRFFYVKRFLERRIKAKLTKEW